jgi:plastocyanin
MKKLIYFMTVAVILSSQLISNRSFAVIHSITAEEFTFTPSVIPEVRIGDTIRWSWINGNHTTTSTTIPSGATAWDHQLNSTSTSYDYIPRVAGNYGYKCVQHELMDMTGSFTVLNVSGVADYWKSPMIKILTNPFTYYFSFQFNSDHSYLQNLKVFDLTGKLCKDLYFNEKPESPVISVNLGDLKTGVYLFEFIDNLKYESARRIVRQ